MRVHWPDSYKADGRSVSIPFSHAGGPAARGKLGLTLLPRITRCLKVIKILITARRVYLSARKGLPRIAQSQLSGCHQKKAFCRSMNRLLRGSQPLLRRLEQSSSSRQHCRTFAAGNLLPQSSIVYDFLTISLQLGRSLETLFLQLVVIRLTKMPTARPIYVGSADAHGEVKVNCWEAPTQIAKWKEEHVSKSYPSPLCDHTVLIALGKLAQPTYLGISMMTSQHKGEKKSKYKPRIWFFAFDSALL